MAKKTAAARRRSAGKRVVTIVRKSTPKKPSLRSIMSAPVVSAGPEDQVSDIAKTMSDKAISCVVILGGNKPIGIISERDIVRFVANRPNLLVGLTAKEVMSTPVHTLFPQTSVDEAKRLMMEKRFRRFPVVDEAGCLVGLVTETDLLHAK